MKKWKRLLAVALAAALAGASVPANSLVLAAEETDGAEAVSEAAAETAAPETEAETAAPETVAPETAAPETVAPETEEPETAAAETTAQPESTEAVSEAGSEAVSEEGTEAVSEAVPETEDLAEEELVLEETGAEPAAEEAEVSPVNDDDEEEAESDYSVSLGPQWSEGEGDEWHTWVFTGESQTIILNTEGLTGLENYTITWFLYEGEEEPKAKLTAGQSSTAATAVDMEVSEDGDTVTLTGKKKETAGLLLKVSVTVPGEEEDSEATEVAEANIGFTVEDPEYNWDYPLSGGNQILPGDDRDISLDCNVRNSDYPYGEYVNVPISNVEIIDSGEWDENGNMTSDEKTRATVDDEDENGVWTAHANNYDAEASYGWIKLKYTWTNPWTEEELTYEDGDGEVSTFLYIEGESYSIELAYREDSNMMQPNDSMTVTASLCHEFIGEDGRDSEYITDFTLEIDGESIDEEEQEYISAEVTEDGQGVVITTKDNGDYEFSFRIIAKNADGEELTDTDVQGYITDADGYYVLLPTELDENPNLGETLRITRDELTLKLYDSASPKGAEVPSANTDFRIRLLDYDTACWDVEEGTEENLIPALIRKKNEDTSLTLVAERNTAEDEEEENWVEVARREYRISGLDYNGADFEYSYGGGDVLFSGETNALTLTLIQSEDKNAWPENYFVSWSVGKVTDDEGNTEDLDSSLVSYEINADDESITLTATEGAELDFNVAVTATISWVYGEDEVKVTDTEAWVWTRNPTYEYDFPANGPGKGDLRPNEQTYINPVMTCHVEDANHPGGENVEVAIKDVEIAAQRDAEGNNVTDDTKIVTLTEENGGWLVTGETLGSADLRITYVSAADGTDQTTGENGEPDVTFYVQSDCYMLELEETAAGTTMVPGESIEVKAKLLHKWVDENGVYQEEYVTADETNDDGIKIWKLSVDEENSSAELLEALEIKTAAEEKVWAVTFTGKSRAEGTIWLQAETYNNEENSYDFVMNNSINLCVTESYTTLESAEIDENPMVGEELDLSQTTFTTVRHYTDEDGNAATEELTDVAYRLEYDEDEWYAKEGTEEDPIPVLIRDRAWDVSVAVVAYSADGDEVGRKDYTFEPNYYYNLGYTFSYGELDEHYMSTVLTDVPLTVTLDTTNLGNLTGYSVDWYVFVLTKLDEEGNPLEFDPDVSVDSVTWNVSADGKSVTLQGVAGKEGQMVWIHAEVIYKGVAIGFQNAGARVTACTHKWDAGTVTQKATCTTAGKKVYTCSVYGEQKTETISAKGHSWSAWKTTSAATVFAAETQKRTCSTCGKSETRTVGKKLTGYIKVTANVSSLKMKTGQKTTTLSVTEMANGDYVKSVTTSNKKIVKASVVNARTGALKLTAQKKTGKAKITITLASGVKKTITIKVQKAKVSTTKISGVAKKATLKKGEKLTLSPTITPITSQDKVKYKSSNKKVATVSSKGVVKAKKKGTATITITSGKKKKTCKITVK